MFVAIDDRKYFTQISNDLEDELPDGVAGSLQRQFLVPEFKKANYGKGISDTIDAYITTIRNKGNAPIAPQHRLRVHEIQPAAPSDSFAAPRCCLIILLIIITRSKSGPGGNDRNRWGGGGFGGGG